MTEPCKDEQDTFSPYNCRPQATACTEDERPGTQRAINDCSTELGRTQEGLTAVGDVTSLFTRVKYMLEDCRSNRRTSRKKKCKGIKATVATITRVVNRVAPLLSAVPIVGKIANAMAKGLKIMNKATRGTKCWR